MSKVIRIATAPLHVLALSLALSVMVLSACSEAEPKAPVDEQREPAARPDGGRADADAGGGQVVERACVLSATADFARQIGCKADFAKLASIPVVADVPGASSVKVVLDQSDADALYFQNSTKYRLHYDFASKHVSSGQGKQPVPQKTPFDETQYYDDDRRFILGAVTYYEDPKLWAFELAPYDTASPEMITKIVNAVKAAAYFGPVLTFHPTSVEQSTIAKMLPETIRISTTDDIYAGTTYQPLTTSRAMGRLRFIKAAQLATEYVGYRDIVVLDKVPNDISVVRGIITEEFQTPLSHINVLSQNRKTPNMGLRNATTNPMLKALDGKWVELDVQGTKWSIRQVTMAEADEHWEKTRPPPVVLPPMDLTVTGLHDVETIVDESQGNLREAIKKSVLAFGGKSAQYSVLANTTMETSDGTKPELPVRKAFAVPIYYYDQFMRENGFYQRIEALLADPAFRDDPKRRDEELKKLRDDMGAAPVNAEFQELLRAKLDADYPDQSMRFRTSTNSEDLDGFPCAGCYESHTGDAGDWEDVLDAIRDTWATVWLFRTFEERGYYGIEHMSVGMGLLVHHNFPEEEANGVALTANPFDEEGLEPGFYVNVQMGGEFEVVHPPPGIISDEFIYRFHSPGQPITFRTRSNLLKDPDSSVLTRRQTYELGLALAAIHKRFSPAYGPEAGNHGWYAMDVEFKFDDEGSTTGPKLYIKQARPHPGRGRSVETD